MHAHRVAVLASVLALAIPAGADTPRPLNPSDQTVLNIRLSAVVLATFREQGGTFPPPYPKLASLESLGSTLGSELRRRLVLRDGWGHSLEILVTHDGRFALISFGADGEPDLPYMKIGDTGGQRPDEQPADPSSPNRDIVFADGDFLQRPHAPEPASNHAAADLRQIATAIESFAVDNEVYPGPTPALQLISAFARDLEADYIRALPREDPWGHPYLVWSDKSSYFLVSAGADGQLDREYSDAASLLAELGTPRPTDQDDDDFVFVNGQFLRSPGVTTDVSAQAGISGD